MKAVVEGLEEDVFRGASGPLRDKRIRHAMFERLGRTDLASLERFLEQQGYVVSFVRPCGSVSTKREDVETPRVNLFTCPKDVFQSRFA